MKIKIKIHQRIPLVTIYNKLVILVKTKLILYQKIRKIIKNKHFQKNNILIHKINKKVNKLKIYKQLQYKIIETFNSKEC